MDPLTARLTGIEERAEVVYLILEGVPIVADLTNPLEPPGAPKPPGFPRALG